MSEIANRAWPRAAGFDPVQQCLAALGICLLVSLALYVVPHPLVALAFGLVPFAMIFAMRNAILLCLGFVIFSFFRIHEVFPPLNPLRIPQLLAIPTLAALGWHVFGTRKIAPFWSRELTIFAIFFGLVTLGVPFATDKPTAFAYWTATYVKIGIMTVAIAWLLRRPEDFNLAARAIVFAGLVVSLVTLYNKVNGIGLVEGTRVTIGRDIGSVLGDPNDLSLVLMFPLSFALSLVVRRTGKLNCLLGAVASAALVAAVIATQSRGGLLGLVAVFGIIGSRLIKSKVTLLIIGVVGLIVLFAAAGISSRASGGAHEAGIDESAMGRIYAWGAAWRMALSRPLNGVGLDNFVANYFFYSEHWDGMNHAVHSTWMGVLAETGFPGLIAFIAMIVQMGRSAWRSVAALDRPDSSPVMAAMAMAVLAGIGGFLAGATFLTQGFTWPIYILLAFTVAVARFAAARSAEAAPPSQFRNLRPRKWPSPSAPQA